MKAILAILLFSLSFNIQAQHEHHKNQHEHHTSKQKIAIHNPTVKVTPPGITNSAGYFHIMNHSNKDIQLVDASSSIAKLTEIHEHVMNNGAMKMQRVDSITIPAKSSVMFKPGGYHVMFINVHEPIVDKQKVEFTLIFSDGTKKTITATAKEQKGSMHKHHGNH